MKRYPPVVICPNHGGCYHQNCQTWGCGGIGIVAKSSDEQFIASWHKMVGTSVCTSLPERPMRGRSRARSPKTRLMTPRPSSLTRTFSTGGPDDRPFIASPSVNDVVINQCHCSGWMPGRVMMPVVGLEPEFEIFSKPSNRLLPLDQQRRTGS